MGHRRSDMVRLSVHAAACSVLGPGRVIMRGGAWPGGRVGRVPAAAPLVMSTGRDHVSPTPLGGKRNGFGPVDRLPPRRGASSSRRLLRMTRDCSRALRRMDASQGTPAALGGPPSACS